MPKIMLAQIHPVLGNKQKNIALIENAIRCKEPDLAVFGEMFLTGYTVRDSLHTLAESVNGNSVRAVKRIARSYGTDIIFGMPEKCTLRRGHVYNSAVFVSKDGEVGVYRKIHLANFGPFEEKQHFAAGTQTPLFPSSSGNLGVLICYDIFFPELAKTYAMKGADIIVCISASPSTTKPFFEKVLVARAIENTAFVLYCNLVGTEQNMVFWGGCRAICPRGNVISSGEPYKEQVIPLDIDLKELEIARRMRPTIKDTRTDVAEMFLKSI